MDGRSTPEGRSRPGTPIENYPLPPGVQITPPGSPMFHVRNDSMPGSPGVHQRASRSPSPFSVSNTDYTYTNINGNASYTNFGGQKRIGGILGIKNSRSSHLSDKLLRRTQQIAAIAQILLGLYLSIMSRSYMYGYMKSTGQIIGFIVILVGFIGLVTGFIQQIHLKTFLIVLIGFCAMLTLEYSASVDRGITVDCTFTEAYLRINHIEERMQQMKHDELVQQLFTRLHEMDEILDMTQQGTLHHIEVTSRQSQLRDQDLNYIEAKIEGLKRHADRALAELVKKQNDITEDTVQNQHALTEEDMERITQEQKLMRMKIDAANSVLKFIKKKQTAEEEISGQEYELLLEALISGHTDEQIRKEREELPFVQAAWERKDRDDYQSIDAGQHLSAAQKLRQQRELRRQKFQQEFEQILQEHKSGHGEHFQQGLQQAIQDLPEHCIKEMSWMNSMYRTCWLILLSLAVSGYLIITSQVSQIAQIKRD